jgi:hypothetical protein
MSIIQDFYVITAKYYPGSAGDAGQAKIKKPKF